MEERWTDKVKKKSSTDCLKLEEAFVLATQFYAEIRSEQTDTVYLCI